MTDYKKIGIKYFKKAKLAEAMTYFSLAYEASKDKNILFFIQLCSLAQESPEEAKMLFEYFISKEKRGEINENFDEILEVLESKAMSDDDFEEQDAIS